MSKTHRIARTGIAAFACLAAFAAAASNPPATDAATLATLDKVLAGNHRSDANRARQAPPPEETLGSSAAQDMAVVRSPRRRRLYTEILAPTLPTTAGTSRELRPNSTGEYVKELEVVYGQAREESGS
jgi:predicted methyltransferase